MAASLLHEAGYKIVGVADIHGALYNESRVRCSEIVRLGAAFSANRYRIFPLAEPK